MGRGARRGIFLIMQGLWLAHLNNAVGATPPAVFAPRVSIDIGGGALGLAAGDFNGDGRRDLAVGNNNIPQLKVLFGQADRTLGTPTTMSVWAQLIGSGDMTVDGRTDVIYNGW